MFSYIYKDVILNSKIYSSSISPVYQGIHILAVLSAPVDNKIGKKGCHLAHTARS